VAVLSRRLVVIAALVTLARPLAAQARPAERAAEFFHAIATYRAPAAAALVDPERLARFQSSRLAVLVAWAQLRERLRQEGQPMLRGRLMGFGSDTALRPEVLATHASMPIVGFGDARTLADVAALTPRVFLTYFFAARVRAAETDAQNELLVAPHRIVAEAISGDTIAYVLYRIEGLERYPDPLDVEILYLRRRRGEWFVSPHRRNSEFTDGPLLELQLTPEERKQEGATLRDPAI
jgi:hypothetical protein